MVILRTCQMVAVPSCWLKCIMLNPEDQRDNPECRSRADSGLTAITELDPGMITGSSRPQAHQLLHMSANWRTYPSGNLGTVQDLCRLFGGHG